MLITIPVCEKDVSLVLKNLDWIDKLGAPYDHPALVTYDETFDPTQVVQAAKKRFKTVTTCCYAPWKCEPHGWPGPQNGAWQQTARHIESHKLGPWLWWEADATPLLKNWPDILKAEYVAAGQPFMGYVVDEHDGHMNGVGVYPGSISAYVRDALLCRAVAFDIVMGRELHKGVHRANHLFQWTPESVSFFDYDQVQQTLNPTACLFHKCKDGSLIDVLQAGPSIVKKVVSAVKSKVAATNTYYHSGNLGDIVYALHAIRKHGGGKLLIGPEQIQTSPCAVPITEAQYQNLKPLLAEQSYICASEFSPRHPRSESVIDLNRFRNFWNDQPVRTKTKINTLCGMHCYTLGVDFDDQEIWLNAPDPIRTGMIAIHRSARYRNETFPWKELVARMRGRLLFVGLPEEHKDFEKSFGRVAFWKPYDFLELARVISGADAFIGNQSFPCSIALGVGQRVCQESWPKSPDCVFNRFNFITQPFTWETFDKWLVR